MSDSVPIDVAQRSDVTRGAESDDLFELAQRVRAEQRERWSEGDRTSAEEYLRRFPELEKEPEAALEVIYGEYLLHEENGEDPAADHFLARFPTYAPRLRLQLQLHRALEESAAESSDATGGAYLDTPAASPSADAELDIVGLPGYEFLEVLGRGSTGLVWKARHRSLNRIVAIKTIHSDIADEPERLARFRAEGQAAARLQHPNIVQIYEVGEHRGRPFFSLEFVDGGSIAERLQASPLAPRDAAEIVCTLARAAQHAHEHGIVHRDLKPANVLLTSTGIPKIADFGLAKQLQLEQSQTQTGAIIGTPSYMAPEQAQGLSSVVGPATDVYALGAILFEMITGRPPFRAATLLETLEQVRSMEVVSPRRLLPKLPRDLETICLKCLQKEPERRYGTALELADDLRRFLNGEPIRARPISRLARTARWCRRNPMLAAASGSAAALLVAAAVLSVSFGLYYRHAETSLSNILRQQRTEAAALAFDRGLSLCDGGDVRQGLLWMAHGLDIAEQAGASDLERALRVNLNAWQTQLHALAGSLAHGGAVNAVAFSPDGRLLAAASDDNTVRLVDLVTGVPAEAALVHSDRVSGLRFAADGKALLTVAGTQARIWQIGSQATHKFTVSHPGRVGAACFSPDGNRFLSAGDDGTARLWDRVSGAAAGPMFRHGAAITCAAFNAAGTCLLTGGTDGIVRLWDVPSGRALGPVLHHEGPIRVALFSPDGSRILSGGSDSTLRQWEAGSGRQLGKRLTHRLPVLAAAFAPDGERIATASRDWSARVWRTANGTPCFDEFKQQGPVPAVAFSPDGKSLLTGSFDGEARLWDLTTGKAIHGPMLHEDGMTAVAFAPDGRTVATGGRDGAVRWWRLAAGRKAATPVDHPGWIYAAAFSPDGDTVALAGEAAGVAVRSLSHRFPAGWLPAPKGISALAISHDGKFLVAGGENREARVWKLPDLRPAGIPIVCHDEPQSVEVSPDGRLLVIGERDGSVSVWDMETHSPMRRWPAHVGRVWGLAFGSASRTLATGGADHMAALWDLQTGKPIGVPVRHRGQVYSVALTLEGSELLTGSADGTAQLWDASTGNALGAAIDLGTPVRTVAFSPDGRLLAVAGVQNRSRLYDRATGRSLGPPVGHTYATLAAHFANDGRRLQLTGEDKLVQEVVVPELTEGKVEEITRHIENITGLRLDADGAVRPVSARERNGKTVLRP
jgi:WD40 repeat protein